MNTTWAWRSSALLLAGVLLAAGMSSPRAACAAEEEDIPLLPGSDPDKPLPEQDELEKQQPKDEDKSQTVELVEKWLAFLPRVGAGVVEGFDNRQAKKFAVVPEAALKLTRGTFENMVAIHKASAENDLSKFGPLADGCLVVAILLDRRKEQTDEIKLGSAFGRLAYTWGHSLLGERVDGVKVEAAAKTVQALASAAPVSRPTWLLFVTGLLKGSIVSPTLGPWVDAEVGRLVQEAPESKDMARMATVRDLVRAMRLAAGGDKAVAGPVLTKVLLPLAPEEAIRKEDTELTSLYNQGISSARRLKVPIKASYRTAKTKSSSNLVAFEFPRGSGWVHNPGDGDTNEGTWVRDNGKREKTTIQIIKFLFKFNYIDEDGKPLGGSNVGGRLKKEFKDAQSKMSKVKKAVDSIGKMSNGIPSSRGFEIRGSGTEADDLWYRDWFFKSEHKEAVLWVAVHRAGKALEPDPEIDFIIESMEEPTPPKGK
jgi:hypothetical protein